MILLLLLSNNEAAAEHAVIVVQHGRLSPRRSTNGLITDYAHLIALDVCRTGRAFPLRVPHAHRRTHGTFRNIAQPVEVACRDLAFEKLLPKRELDLVRLGVYRGNVKLAPVIKSRAALADGVAVYALVTAYDFAMENEASGGGSPALAASQEI